MSVIRTFQRLLESLKIALWKLREEESQTWDYWQLIYPARKLAKCTMRADALNPHGYPAGKKIIPPSSHIFLRTRTNQKKSFWTKIYRRVILWTNTNAKESSSTKLYHRFFLHTRMNQKAPFSTKLYRRAVTWTSKNYVPFRNINQNVILGKKKTQTY